MRIRNISAVPVVVAGLSVPPRHIGEIPDDEWTAWMARSSGNQLTASTKLQVVVSEPPAAELLGQVADGDEKPAAVGKSKEKKR